MSETLSSIRDKVKAMLQDDANLVFDPATIESCIRFALDEYGLAKGAVQTISGLDGAVTTTVPDLESIIIQIGAAGYAVEGRVVKRSESFNFKQYIPREIRSWGEDRIKDFQRMLERVRTGTFHGANAVPWHNHGWAMDSWDPNGGGGI